MSKMHSQASLQGSSAEFIRVKGEGLRRLFARFGERDWVSLAQIVCVLSMALAVWAWFSPSVQETGGSVPPHRLGTYVPFVGCKSDGQMGPLKSPEGKSKSVPIAPDAAEQFAYYKSEYGFGVLAPRGWQCFGLYGANGSTLYISPTEIVAANLLSTTWNGFPGPAIEIAERDGDTSGRFEVARAIAHVFPTHRAFVDGVIREGIEPASSFPFGPYPKDKLTYLNKEMVEYQTPANTDGLGTNSRLEKNDDSISGVAILMGETPNLLFLSVRLSPNQTGLRSTIIRQVERDAAQPAHAE